MTKTALKQEFQTISSSVAFYENLIGQIIEKIENLQGWRPDYNEKTEQFHNQINQIINKINYEQKQMLEFEIKMNEFAVGKLSKKVNIIFNPNK